MKKFEIKSTNNGRWIVSHHEFPKFTCTFEDKKFTYSLKIIGLSDPGGNPEEIKLLHKMEKWLTEYHKEKING
ncbi:hypothetical protein [Flavobacterium sp. MDT1-60]|uniref:hypothetical protein n=1 Tax=Flavobacterium sp. MDT1-60 TaxID=1979344 RepID=UPI00177D930A|nr:hypothetical protein [Flavobacterium sp. MDT1-60]QOG01098.1 hypothetical protein IHE43_14885 [Flavobacterium sp. MDT1-60]